MKKSREIFSFTMQGLLNQIETVRGGAKAHDVIEYLIKQYGFSFNGRFYFYDRGYLSKACHSRGVSIRYIARFIRMRNRAIRRYDIEQLKKNQVRSQKLLKDWEAYMAGGF